MSVHLLLEGRWPDYLAEAADDPSALWLFLHIPKTAGSSFRAELANRLKPEANIAVDYTEAERPFHERLQAAVDGFRQAHAEQRHRFASGHIQAHHAAQIAADEPRLRLITMLRDPVARVVSDYRYQRTPAHPPHRSFIEQYPDFASYVRSPASQNLIHHYLRRSPEDSAEQVIEQVERDFTFVGITEMYYLSCRILFRLLGINEPPSVYERRTEASEANQIDDLEALTAEIRALNDKDLTIYRHFHTRLKAQRTALLQALGVGA
ncbi:MAG TPA: sulfotransferase domain-containing protein [Nevskiaceae bacterium]|nr:sulfotransferase domain-containing protein [Nevskiaceae bacterium]